MRKLWPYALALAALLPGASCDTSIFEPDTPQPAAAAPAPDPGFTRPAGAVFLANQQAKMRDGARLNTQVWLPKGEGKFPVVLVRTPYETETSSFTTKLLNAGYAVVQQHERGRYLSEGKMRMLGRADEDGWDTLNWIAKQPWTNGKVGTFGCSSSAENQLKLASLGHPTHKAMIVGSSGVGIAEIGPHHEQGNFWRGGVWQEGWANYFFEEMQTDWPQLEAKLSDAERARRIDEFPADKFPGANISADISQETYNAVRMHLPMIDIGKAAKAPKTELEDYLARGPSGAVWAEDRVTDKDVIKVPGLWAEALYDISPPAAVAFFEKTRKENAAGTQALVVTNGQHCSFRRPRTKIGDRPLGDATFDYDRLALAWLDRWLKDDKFSGTPLSPVTAYMAGINRWASFNEVPSASATQGRTFYLSSGGAANTTSGNGVLQAEAPRQSSSDRFTYDPANPVISNGGQISGMGTDQRDGAFDQSAIEQRQDVLVYSSEPLTEDLAVFGYIDTQLFVSSSAFDTDFTVKLVDVEPNGVAWNISDTILRMRYRSGEDQPVFMRRGEVYAIKPPPMLAANVFLKGHRIRVEVSSSNFPSYARNLNTVRNPYTETEYETATNQVLHGPGQLSRITLPVVTLPERRPRAP
ncbi:MAG TPA: CocE/NonD family hydrolase [Hyphomonadaceae bacterium]|nr:CocE/NonD family hydrolase [Hyphomonadaceae bacterium]